MRLSNTLALTRRWRWPAATTRRAASGSAAARRCSALFDVAPASASHARSPPASPARRRRRSASRSLMVMSKSGTLVQPAGQRPGVEADPDADHRGAEEEPGLAAARRQHQRGQRQRHDERAGADVRRVPVGRVVVVLRLAAVPGQRRDAGAPERPPSVRTAAAASCRTRGGRSTPSSAAPPRGTAAARWR